MHVIHTSRFGATSHGGTESYIKSAAEHLARGGVESSWLHSGRRSQHGQTPKYLVSHAIGTLGPDWFMLGAEPRTLAHRLSRGDVVHAHDLRFCFPQISSWCRRRATPLIVSTHGLIFHTERRQRAKSVVWRHSLLPALRSATAVLASSPADFELCRDLGVGNNLQLFENPVDISGFCLGREYDDVARTGDTGVHLLYFGRIASNKSLTSLVRLAAREPHIRVSIVGGGACSDLNATWSSSESSTRKRVSLVGALPHEDLVALMQSADCLVFPSTYEGFGLTLVEGMATGIPCVANDIAPFRRIAERSDVLICNTDSVDDFAHTVGRAVALGGRTRSVRRAREFSWTNRVDALTAIYHAALDGMQET